MTVYDDLMYAKRTLTENRWWHEVDGKVIDENGLEDIQWPPTERCYCLYTALPLRESFRQTIFYLENYLGVDRVWEYNDAPGRTKQEVLDILQEAADRWLKENS